MTQLESLAGALPRVLPVLVLAALWAVAVAWRHRENRREQTRRTTWMQSHTRGGDPRP